MIGLKTRVLVKHLLDEGLTRAAIAERLELSERTIRRWIASGEVDHPLEAAQTRSRRPRPRKIDPYAEIIRTRLERFPELSARRLFEEIRKAGYEGGYSQLAAYVQRIRPKPSPEPIVRFETLPGEQGQVDFATFSFPFGRRYALVVVLGYSRMLFVRFFQRQDLTSLMTGLEEAFAYFGGVPRELLFDQMRSVITRDERLSGGALITNEEFLRFAHHWRFRVRACRPYRARTKGKVERPIRYLRENFVYGRTFTGDEHLAEACLQWLERANGRLHATTREVPRRRLERDEKAQLLPLAAQPYRSLVLPPKPRQAAPLANGPVRVPVEKRPLSVYAALIGGPL